MGNNSQTTDQSQQQNQTSANTVSNNTTGSTNNTQTANSANNPWAAAIPGLQNIIGQLNGGGGSLTAPQSSAVSTLQGEAGSVPSFGAQGANAVSGLFNSTTAPQVGMWNGAYNQFQGAQSPYLSPSYTSPMTAPGLGTALSTMNTDITNQVGSQFAAAGRTGSPAEAQALARGLSQGEGGLISNEYNQLVGQQQGAANSLLGGAGATAGGTASLGQIPLQNAVQGINSAGSIPGLWTQPGSTQLTAANIGQQLPYQNLQMPFSMLGQAGSLGGTSSSTGNTSGNTISNMFGNMFGNSSGTNTGTSTTTQPVNPWTTAAGLGLGAAALFSDERLKEDIKPIGLLFNGLTAYRYRYKHDPDHKMHVGVMAQDVEKVHPEAVSEAHGFKTVDYSKATEPIGLWGRPTAMAA